MGESRTAAADTEKNALILRWGSHECHIKESGQDLRGGGRGGQWSFF